MNMKCQKILMAHGHAYPRTCEACGLYGPCKEGYYSRWTPENPVGNGPEIQRVENVPPKLYAGEKQTKKPLEFWRYNRCSLNRVIDGDTIEVRIDLGWGITLEKQIIRLAGINAPELPTPEGVKSTNMLGTYLGAGTQSLTIDTIKDKREKYGRMLGIIYVGNININEQMVATGYAKEIPIT
jgi:micrococcal nuclease